MDTNSNSPQLSRSVIDTDLADLKDIEKIISSQLDELGNKIDKSFSNIANTVKGVTDLITDFKDLSTGAELALNVGAGVAATVILGVGAVYNSYKKDQALSKLLVQKQQIAQEKKGAIEKLVPKLEHLNDRYSKVLGSFISKDYKLENLHEENYTKPLFFNLEKSLEIERSILYNKSVADYLLAEYNAWLAGKQHSDVARPTILTVNKKIDGMLDNPDLLSLFEKYSIQTSGKISGKELCFLHDNQLLTTSVIENNDRIFSRKSPDKEKVEEKVRKELEYEDSNKKAGKIRLKITCDNTQFGVPDTKVVDGIQKTKKNIGMILPRPDYFDAVVEDFNQYSRAYKSHKFLTSFTSFLKIAVAILVFFLIRSTDWATWLQWLVGIPAVLITIPIVSHFCKKHLCYPKMVSMVKIADGDINKYANNGVSKPSK